MLTRLNVSGFKNLVDTEIRFGPLTCIAGFNGVGKSNIFDAIRFLSLLADHTFVEAARLTRGGADAASLFTAGGDRVMHLDCDLIIQSHGQDDFHQPTEASHTFLNYIIELALVQDEHGFERFELRHEELGYVTLGDAKNRLGFEASSAWQDSAFKKSQRRAKYIETEQVDGHHRIRLSTDKMKEPGKSKRGGGKPTDFFASGLPRSVLSAAQNADEARTAVLARAEMRSWRILQLEPSSLRQPDDIQAPSRLSVEGRHLPATFYRLTNSSDGPRLAAEVSNRLARLVDDVREVRVVRDDARRSLQLVLTDTSGREFAASSLSDGTLRFVALSVLEKDSAATGVVCLEEPENGIHPERMGAMIELLTDMATDVSQPIDETNPLRQVIISTHSPVVVAHTLPKDLVFADRRNPPTENYTRHPALVVRPCEKTWRLPLSDAAPLAKGDIIRYLGAISPETNEADRSETTYQMVVKQLALFGDGM